MAEKPSLTIVWPDAAVLFQAINLNLLPVSVTHLTKRARFRADKADKCRLLLNLLGVKIEHNDLPVAQLRSHQSLSICADPCYLHADRDRLLLFADDLQLAKPDAQELIESLKPLFPEFQARLKIHTAEEWVVSLDKLPDLVFHAMPQLEGQSVNDKLPAGNDQRDWLRLWNEIQMTLFEHPVNQQRVAAGLLPINAVWFWGKGELEFVEKGWQLCVGQDPQLKQLCELAEITHQMVLSPLLKQNIQSGGQQLIVLPAFDHQNDWDQQLEQVNQQIFAPIWEALRNFKIKQIQLHIPFHGYYQLKHWQSWLGRR